MALVAPTAALAQNAPPGNSEVHQYLETVPGADGDRPTNRPAPDGGEAEPADDPRYEGADGELALRLAGGEESRPKRSDRRDEPARGSVNVPSGSSPPAAVAEALAGRGGDGLGTLLPVLLGLIGLGALAGIARIVAARRS